MQARGGVRIGRESPAEYVNFLSESIERRQGFLAQKDHQPPPKDHRTGVPRSYKAGILIKGGEPFLIFKKLHGSQVGAVS